MCMLFRSYVALYDHLVAAPLQGVAYVAARHRAGVVDVDIVHAAVQRHGHQLQRRRAVKLLEAAAADAYLAHHQPRLTQRTVLHIGLFLNSFMLTSYRYQTGGSHH